MADVRTDWDMPPSDHWPLVVKGKVNTEDLRLWLQKMSLWAQRVRADILRLEKAYNLKQGDPGPPPPPPE